MAEVLLANQGKAGSLGALGLRFMITSSQSAGGFALIEQTLGPNALAAPRHRHSREDEYSYVLAGRLGALLGDDAVFGGVGDLIFKPRGQWHTYWNALATPTTILELIAPGGFEGYFDELMALFKGGRPAPEVSGAVAARYGMEMDYASIPALCATHGLKFG